MSFILGIERVPEGTTYWYPVVYKYPGGMIYPACMLPLMEAWKCPLDASDGRKVKIKVVGHTDRRRVTGSSKSDWVIVRNDACYVYSFLEKTVREVSELYPYWPPEPPVNPPEIDYIDPNPVLIGDKITIHGYDFDVTPLKNRVWYKREKWENYIPATTIYPYKLEVSLSYSHIMSDPCYKGDAEIWVERIRDGQTSNRITLGLLLPEPVCSEGDKKCENGDLYYCKYGMWWLWEHNSPECPGGPPPPPDGPPEPPPEPPPTPEAPYIDSVYPVPCPLDGKLNIIGSNFSPDRNRNWLHFVRSGYTEVLTRPDTASSTNLSIDVGYIGYALAPGNWALYVETIIDDVHQDSNRVTVTFGEELPPPPPPPGQRFTLTTSVSPKEGGWVGRDPSRVAYEPGARVELNALPARDYKFTGWGGDATGTADTTYVTMDSDKYVIANFESTLLPDIPIVKQIIEWIRDALVTLRQWFDGMLIGIINRIKAALEAVWSTLTAPIATAVNWIKGKVSDAWFWIKAILGKISELPSTIWSTVTSAVSSGIAKVWEWITSAAAKVISDVKMRLQALQATLGTFLDKVKSDIWARLIEVRDFLDGKLWAVDSLIHHLIYQEEGHFFASREEAKVIKADIIASATSEIGGIKTWFTENVTDPITDWFKEWWEDLKARVGGVWNTIITWLRTFFTETIPNLATAAWGKMKAAAAWVSDTVGGLLSDAFEYVMGLIKAIAPISPEGGVGAFSGMAKIGIALAGGLGIMTVAGNLVHPLHSLGFEHVSAMVYDLTNYKLLTGAMMGALAASAIRTPISYYFNSLLRPWLLDRRSFMDLMSRRAFTDPAALRNPDLSTTVARVAGGNGRAFEDRMIGYFGNPAEYYGFFKELANTPLRYFPLAGIARTGFFETEWFTEALHRSGYSETAVEALMVMYRKMADESVRGTMSGAALTRFKEGFTTETQFSSEMALLGYSDMQFQTYLAAARMDYATDYLRDLLYAYRDAVRKGNLSLDEYRSSLLALGMVPERVEGYILRERARLKPTEALTPIAPAKPEYETDAGRVKVDTIRRQRRKEVISRDQEISRLQFLGMDPGYAAAIADNDDIRLAEKP